jgi:putative ABC transport system substrate-binding protein
MHRRAFIGSVAAGLAVPFVSRAQGDAKAARIAYLAGGSVESPDGRALLQFFRRGLQDLGYVEGKTIVIEYRAADGRIELLPDLASDLARSRPDVIVAASTAAARAAKQATKTIPIVAFAMTDPVGDGLVTSLARPDGNITGSTFIGRDVAAKNLTLLKEAVPAVSRVAALWHPGAVGERTIRELLNDTETAAATLRVRLRLVDVRSPDQFEHAFSTMTRERDDGLMVFPSTMLFNARRRIVDLAAKHRLPAIYGAKEFPELGGLMSYGASQADLFRRAATYVDKILKGAKPADLPIEQPVRFELVINTEAAKRLGLTIPNALLLRADALVR